MANRTFIKQIRDVDALYSKSLEEINGSAEDFQILASSWNAVLKKLLDENFDQTEIHRLQLLSIIEKEFPDSYISPIFKASIKLTGKFQALNEISKYRLNKFRKETSTCKSAAEAEELARQFRISLGTNTPTNYFITKTFRPKHPLHYLLDESHEKNTRMISSDVFVHALNTVIHNHQFYKTSTLTLCLAVGAGLSLQETAMMHNPKPTGKNKVTFQPSSRSKKESEVQTLCHPKDFCKAASYLKEQKISKTYAQAIDSSFLEEALGLSNFSFKTIPALHASLLDYFSIKNSKESPEPTSKFMFEIKGNEDLGAVLESSKANLDDLLSRIPQEHRKNADIVFRSLRENPFQRATARQIKEWLRCSTSTALSVQKAILKALKVEIQ